jgi:microcystin-dependent protein
MRFLRTILLALLALGAGPALASQGTGCMPTTGTVSGLTLSQNINAAVAALISSNSGASAPATDCTAIAITGQVWLDTSATPARLKVYDGTSWLPIGSLDASGHVWQPALGGGLGSLTAAATTDLCSVGQNFVTITGTTTVSAFGSSCASGQMKVVKAAAAFTLTYNASSMILPGAASITTTAGDQIIAVALGGGNWTVASYLRASGAPVGAASGVAGIGAATTIASAATTDIGTLTTHFASITGTTAITSFGSSAATSAPIYQVRFSAALVLTYNGTSMILPGGASIATAANDSAVAQYLGSGNWQILTYQSATDVGVLSGEIKSFAMSSCPGGWFEADGSAISRTTYANLYANLGTAWGVGDGSTTFNLPDARGQFLRGWDHGRGVDTSRAFASTQADDFKSHTHSGAPSGSIGVNTSSSAFIPSGASGTTGATGGTETRPKNIAILYCVKS